MRKKIRTQMKNICIDAGMLKITVVLRGFEISSGLQQIRIIKRNPVTAFSVGTLKILTIFSSAQHH